MSRSNLAMAVLALRAFRAAGVLRPLPPRRMLNAVRAARALHATPATSVAIAAACDPDGVAVIDEAGRLTWREMDRRVRSLAQALRDDHQAGPDAPIAVLCRNHRGILEALAAAARTGADVLALNTEFAAPQIAAVVTERRPATIVCDGEFVDRVREAAPEVPIVVAWDDAGEARRAGVPTIDELSTRHPQADPVHSRRSRIVILTSGTTGTPKGAARDLPLRDLLGSIVTLIEQLELHRTRPVFVAPPLFHGFGLAVASIAQSLGAPVVLQRRFDAESTVAAIASERVGCLMAVPVMLQRMVALPPATRARYDTRSLRSALSAGAPLAPHVAGSFMDAFGDVLCNGYGSTETGFGAIASPQDLRAAPGTIGRAPHGARLRILDENRREVGPGTVGHVFVGGDLVFDGYTGGGSKETADGGLMNTGDLGHKDASGRAFIDGREDDMIVSGGENVFPQEVEDALAAHPQLAEVAVLGVADDEFGQRLQAFVVPAAGRAPSPADLVAHLRGRLERYKIPRDIFVVEQIPRTATGKVLRRELTATAEVA